MLKLPYFAPEAEVLEVGVSSVFLDTSNMASAPELGEGEDWSEIW